MKTQGIKKSTSMKAKDLHFHTMSFLRAGLIFVPGAKITYLQQNTTNTIAVAIRDAAGNMGYVLPTKLMP